MLSTCTLIALSISTAPYFSTAPIFEGLNNQSIKCNISMTTSGLEINSKIITGNWSVSQIEAAIGEKGRWVVPTDAEREQAMIKYGRPLTTDTYVYDDFGLQLFVDHNTGKLKSIIVHLGGRQYKNTPVSPFLGIVRFGQSGVSRKSTLGHLKSTLNLRPTKLPFIHDIVYGPFKYSFITDDGSNASLLAEIDISLVQ